MKFSADARVGAYEVKTNLARLLNDAERGLSVTITRNGQPVARLVPAFDDVSPAAQIVMMLRSARRGLHLHGETC